MIDASAVYSVAPNISYQNLGAGEGAVVLALDTGQLHTCNDTTSTFLSLLDGVRSFDAVIDEMAETFDVERDQLKSDLIELATQLLAEGLIV